MKSKVNSFAKEAMTIGVTGIGLGVMVGAASDSPYAASAIGTMGKGLGTISSLTVMKHSTGMLSSMIPKKKK